MSNATNANEVQDNSKKKPHILFWDDQGGGYTSDGHYEINGVRYPINPGFAPVTFVSGFGSKNNNN